MSTAIHSFDDDAESVLIAMGLNGELMAEVCRRGLAQYLTATPHHPVNAPGTFLYLELVRSMRDILLSNGWEPVEDSISLTYNDDLSIALAVSSGDSYTGDRNRIPSFKYPKGSATEAAVAGNANQLGLFDGIPGFAEFTIHTKPKRINFDTVTTWWLLHHVNPGNGVMRAELSLPIKIGNSGETNKWESRIILEAISFDDEPDASRLNDGPDAPDFDVDIKRKA